MRISNVETETDFALEPPKPAQPSMLYQMLPTVVTSRLPTLPSLRKSLNEVRNRGLHSKSSSLSVASEPTTPPPGYSTRPGSSSATPNHFSLGFTETEFDFSDDASEQSSLSGSAPVPMLGAHETATGINWKYASQGRNLITQAQRESNMLLQDIDEISASLTRQLYIHGITYLLRGLPPELTQEEIVSLHAALPTALADKGAMVEEYAWAPASQRATKVQTIPSPQDQTILQRIIAAVIFHTFAILQFLLPYIGLLISSAYQFERKYQITNRMVNTGVMTVDEMSRGGLRLSQTVCQMNEGRVGQALHDMALWWIRGVTGGIQQGLEEVSAAKMSNEGGARAQ